MTRTDLIDLTEYLRAIGLPASLEETGGGTLTIYVGPWQRDGRATLAVGPTGESIGPDDDEAGWWEEIPPTATVPEAARRIVARYALATS